MSAISIGAVYGRLAGLRRSWYARRPHAQLRLDRPVISVGNLVVGGGGKTPVVAALARLLLEWGERPAVLSRGYARRDLADGVVVVSNGHRVLEGVDRSGDEPQMLARALPEVPVLVSPDRYLAGRLAERRFGATVLLLDDGFQHLQLARTLDLLLMSAPDLDEPVLPSGRLRESLDAARVADALLVRGLPDEAARVAAAVGVEAAFAVAAHYDPLRWADDGAAVAHAAGGRVVAVAGIARPERFFRAVQAQGWEVGRALTFRDHHWFTPKDVARAAAAAREASADLIVTTEKDAMRLRGGVRWAVLPMRVTIEPAEAFSTWLRARL